MMKISMALCVFLLVAGLLGACVPAATPPPIDAPAATMPQSETAVSTLKPATATAELLTINTLCTHKGERVEIQGILRLPDSVNCTKSEKPNWCTVQLYDPYYDKTIPVNLYVTAGGMTANQMAAIPKSYDFVDLKVQTGAGGLVGHGSLVALSGKIGSVSQATGGVNEVGCALTDVVQVAALKQLTPVGMDVKKYELADALASGAVVAAINGGGLERLELKLKPQGNTPLEINILPGTIFEPLTGGVQNMVVRKAALAVLKPNLEVSLELDVACANMEKKEPTGTDTFKISQSPAAQDLQKLLGLAEFIFATNRVQQFAIWTITDNPHKANYVGIETSAGATGGPSNDEITEIRRLFTAAGITPTQYNLFK